MIHGIRQALVMHTRRAPARSMPCFSDSRPTIRPGLVGEVDERQVEHVAQLHQPDALTPAATSVAPPRCIGSLAITPTG